MASPTRDPNSRRRRAVQRIRARLAKRRSPRLQMLMLLLLTGAVGFGAAVALLSLGVERMAVRYPLAVLIAYGAFLLFLRLWLRSMLRRRRHRDRDPDFDVDVLDIGVGGGRSGGGSGGGPRFGGGSGGGGGAGGSWSGAPETVPAPAMAPAPMPLSASGSGAPAQLASAGGGRGGGGGKSGGWLPDVDLGDLGDLDDSVGCLVVALIALAVLAVLAAAGYALAVAPVLLAELVVDGIVIGGLYRAARRIDEGEWLQTALRRTWIPALLLALLLGAVGWGIQRELPWARSLGDVWRAIEAADEDGDPSATGAPADSVALAPAAFHLPSHG
jgi:hypothetical protein